MASLNTVQIQLLNSFYKYEPALHLWTSQGGSLLGDIIASQGTAISTDMLNGYIHETATGQIVLCESSAYTFTIGSLIGETSSGTVTATLKINGVAVTGISAQSWTTSQSTKTATAANTVAVGDRVILDIDSGSVYTKFGFTVRITRT